MLAEAVIAGADKLRGYKSGKLSPSIVSPCPTRTYKNWKVEKEPATGLELLRMNDGHYQEQEMIDDLIRAGFAIKDRQRTVHIRGLMDGHIDGCIQVDNKWKLLDCKAMSLDRYTKFKQRGFESESTIKVQGQLYLASTELQEEDIDEGFIYSKHKDTCRPFDLFFKYESYFIDPIIDMVGELYKGWIPEPIRCSLCPTCRYRLECWGAQVVDFSGVHTSSLPELVEQWKLGTNYKRYGKELIEEAREVFEKELGGKQVVFIDDLKCMRIFSSRSGISETKFVEKYGAAALAEVWEERKIPQMRIQEVEL